MKKGLFILATAAVVLAGCNNDVVLDENVAPADPNAPQEIGFTTLNAPVKRGIKRAPVNGTGFPSGQDMYVAAYDAEKGADFFDQTTFDEDGTSGLWKADPKKYWPMDDATLNFLAYTGIPSGSYFDGTHPAQGLVIALGDNSSNQYDLMYAFGRGTRARGAAAANVNMAFKHALAQIVFTAKSAGDYGTSLKLQSIVLTGAKYSGTYTINNAANYNSKTSDFSTTKGAWSLVSTQTNVTREPATVDGWDAAGDATVTETAHQVGLGILVVPDDNAATADFTSFTINYTLDGNPYTYTFTPATDAAKNVDQAKKYTFNIIMTLNEIIIAPEVEDYTPVNTDVDVK